MSSPAHQPSACMISPWIESGLAQSGVWRWLYSFSSVPTASARRGSVGRRLEINPAWSTPVRNDAHRSCPAGKGWGRCVGTGTRHHRGQPRASVVRTAASLQAGCNFRRPMEKFPCSSVEAFHLRRPHSRRYASLNAGIQAEAEGRPRIAPQRTPMRHSTARGAPPSARGGV